MKKFLLVLGIVFSALSFYSCKQELQMSDPKMTDYVKKLVEDNFKAGDNKIVSIRWYEETLKNTLSDVTIYYVGKSDTLYRVSIDAETKKLGEPKATTWEVDYDNVTALNPSEINADSVQKYGDILASNIPEGYKFKSVGSFEVSRDYSQRPIGVKSIPLRKRPDGLKYEIVLRMVNKDGGKSRSGRMITTTYYEIKCEVDTQGNVSIKDN